MSSGPFINSGGSCCCVGVLLPLLEGLKVNLYICSIAAGKYEKKIKSLAPQIRSVMKVTGCCRILRKGWTK